MNKKRFWALLVLVGILFLFVSGCAGVARIESFISGGEFKQHAKLIDFMLFFVIFFAMSYLGFSKVWGKGFGEPGKGRGAIVGLSIALALALAFAIISQTSFSITTIYPLAKALFFIIVWFLLWGLFNKTEMLGKGWLAKVAYAILALILTYLLLSIFTHFVCQMSDNMDDPACDSDFFNAIFKLLGRWFGVESWASSGGGGFTGDGTCWFFCGDSGGGGGGGTSVITPSAPSGISTTSTPGTQAEPEPLEKRDGPIEGECRLDLEFVVNEHDKFTKGSSSAVQEYITKAANSGRTVYVYGFASIEGTEKRNKVLSGTRASFVAGLIKGFATVGDIDVIPVRRSMYTTTEFGLTLADLAPNRRVVLSTDTISKGDFYPAPPPGTIYGCEEKEGEEPSSTPAFKDIPWWLPVLFVLALLWLWWMLRRKKRKKPDYFVAMKKKFLDKLRDLQHKKIVEFDRNIREQLATLATSVTEDEITLRAQNSLNVLEKELQDAGWHDIAGLAKDYQDDFSKIEDQINPDYPGAGFDVSPQKARRIVELLEHVKKNHVSWKDEPLQFQERLLEAAKFYVHNNAAMGILDKFLDMQKGMEELVVKFSKEESLLLNQLRKKRIMYVTTEGILEATQAAKNLCDELMAKIDEVTDAAENTSHFQSTVEELKNRFNEENELIGKLVRAVEHEKRLLEEDWFPVIDNIDPKTGKMEGHIHKRR